MTDLVVGGAESPAHVLVVQHLHLEGEVLLELQAQRHATWLKRQQAEAHTQRQAHRGRHGEGGRSRGSPYVLDDHDEEGQLDAECLLGLSGASDVVGGHVGAHDLQHRRLDVLVRDALDVPIPHCHPPRDARREFRLWLIVQRSDIIV